MEFLQVFDKNKIALDEKIERSLKKTLNNGKHFMIILLFIQNENKQFLIQKTSEEKDHIYATTGGHVTYKDTSIETVLKETKEELGINLVLDDIILVDTIDCNTCFCDIYYTNKKITMDDITLQEEEVESVEWLSEQQIQELINNNEFRKGNIEPFNKVLKFIKKNEL